MAAHVLAIEPRSGKSVRTVRDLSTLTQQNTHTNIGDVVHHIIVGFAHGLTTLALTACLASLVTLQLFQYLVAHRN